MSSYSRKRRNERALATPFGTDAYLDPCPVCRAAVGDRCVKVSTLDKPPSGRVFARTPHPERLALQEKVRDAGLRNA